MPGLWTPLWQRVEGGGGSTAVLDSLPTLTEAGSLIDAVNLKGARGICTDGAGHLMVAAYENDRLTILASTKDTPELVSSVKLPGGNVDGAVRLVGPRGVDYRGGVCAVISSLDQSIHLYSVADWKNPALLATLTNAVFGGGHRIRFDGRWLYTTGTNFFGIVDAAEPRKPRLAGWCDLTGEDLFGMEIDGDTAYVAASATHKYWSIPIANKWGARAALDSIELPGSGPHSIVVDGIYGYTANSGTDSVDVINVADPANLAAVGATPADPNGLLNGAHTLHKLGRYLLVCAQSASGFTVVDAITPEAPLPVGQVANAATMDGVRSMCVDGDRAWGAAFTSHAVATIDLKGLVAASARIGTVHADEANVRGPLQAGHVKANQGLTVGPAGADVEGDLTAANFRGEGFEGLANLVGFYTVPPHGSRNTNALTLDRLHLVPWRLRRRTRYDRIGAELTAALAASVLRLGLYHAAGDTRLPAGAALLDSTLDGNSAPGWLENNIDLTLAPGLYWLVAVQQGALATWRTIANPSYSIPMPGTAAMIGATNGVSLRGNAPVAGALPADPPILVANIATLFPLVGLRVAA